MEKTAQPVLMTSAKITRRSYVSQNESKKSEYMGLHIMQRCMVSTARLILPKKYGNIILLRHTISRIGPKMICIRPYCLRLFPIYKITGRSKISKYARSARR